MDQKEIEKKAYEFEMHKEQIKQVQAQAVQIQKQVQEIESVKASLLEFKKTKDEKDAFIPLGAGIFASGKITDFSEVLVLTGAGVAIRKSVEDAIIFLEEKLNILNKSFDELNSEMNKIGKRAEAISYELQKISGN